MTTVVEVVEAYEWLDATLKGDATIQSLVGNPARVHEHPAPQGTVSPYITVQSMAPLEDLDVVGAHRVWTEGLFLVRAVAETASIKVVEPIAKRIDELLHRSGGATADGRVVSSTREEAFYLPEFTNGKSYRHLGGVYRLYIQPLNP